MALGTQIPSQIVIKLIPIISKQFNIVADTAEKSLRDCINLPNNIQCNDPAVKQIKDQLQSLQNSIQQLSSILNSASNITSAIQMVAGIAATLKVVQLAIPSAPGVPSGPIAELIAICGALIANSKSAVNCLNSLIDNIKIQFARINSLIATVINTLSSICHDETFEVSADVNDLIVNQTSTNLSDQYPSEFYTDINVSDDDINNRLILINDLVQQQLDVVSNLIEAPTKILTGATTPIFEQGDLNDYYVNYALNQMYGPKTESGWGQPVNL
jgi:prefoldin subunit 5